MLRNLMLALVFAVCLHVIQGHVLQQNATERWSKVSHKYQRLYRASYYNVHDELLTWLEASNVCGSEGAHLLIINSPAEAAVVKRFLDPTVETYSVGFHDLFNEGTFTTVQCQSLLEAGYSVWALLEPSSFYGENCGGINNQTQLLDIICSNHYPFICEYES